MERHAERSRKVSWRLDRLAVYSSQIHWSWRASSAAASSAAPPNPAAAYAEHKFLVLRSKMGNLPVYYKVSNGGTNERTVLRKYGGDVNKLIAALQTVVDDAAIALGKHPRHLPVPIRLYHGRLEVKGRWTRTISDWLTGLGF